MPLACEKCGSVIAPKRIEAILATTGSLPTTCVRCAKPARLKGFSIYGHKTAGEVVVIDPSNKDLLRRATREYRRSR